MSVTGDTPQLAQHLPVISQAGRRRIRRSRLRDAYLRGEAPTPSIVYRYIVLPVLAEPAIGVLGSGTAAAADVVAPECGGCSTKVDPSLRLDNNSPRLIASSGVAGLADGVEQVAGPSAQAGEAQGQDDTLEGHGADPQYC